VDGCRCGKLTPDVFNDGVSINEAGKVTKATVAVMNMAPLFRRKQGLPFSGVVQLGY
jgi:hypothetical protein